MNLKIKSTLIIIFTLLLGMAIGIFVAPNFYPPPPDFADKMSRLRSPEGFMARFEQIIQPTEDQKEKIREILSNHFERMHQQSRVFREQFRIMNDSLRQELDPILDENQKLRLQEMAKRYRDFDRPDFGPHHRRPKRDFKDKRIQRGNN